MWKLSETTESGLRKGALETKSGVIHTPFFMPDATRASVRGLSSEELVELGVEALVINTYHLYLQPGTELIKKAGGVHEFMQWPKPLLSDSGGYQVYSLIHKNPTFGKITEEGAEFRSPIDGSKHLITPERSMQIQFDLGADMIVCLDDPRPNSAPVEEIAEAVERTFRWAKRCREEYERQVQARGLDEAVRPLLFGVVQGGMVPALRKRSAEGLISIGFDGYGFGARHIDSAGVFLADIVEYTASLLPADKPRFALGIGTPADIVRSARSGWDMFDCVIPTREGRHGRLFIRKEGDLDGEGEFYEAINITNEAYKEDFSPVDPSCDCPLCQNYTRAYLRYLFSVGEALAPRLATVHNLRFYLKLMQELREK